MVRRAFTLVEMMIVIAIVAVLAAIAIPALYKMQLKSKRTELVLLTEDLRNLLIVYQDTEGFTPGSTVYEQSPGGTPGKTRRAWASTQGFETLGFHPDGMVYGTVWFGHINDNRLQVGGYCNVDGDGTSFSRMDVNMPGTNYKVWLGWQPETSNPDTLTTNF